MSSFFFFFSLYKLFLSDNYNMLLISRLKPLVNLTTKLSASLYNISILFSSIKTLIDRSAICLFLRKHIQTNIDLKNN